MSEISSLGLGLMGSAVARSFVNAGHRLTVWNRSEPKTQPLVQRGASAADSVRAAVAASPVVLICIDGIHLRKDRSMRVIRPLDGEMANNGRGIADHHGTSLVTSSLNRAACGHKIDRHTVTTL